MRVTVTVIALFLALGTVLASSPATNPEEATPQPKKIKLYYGLPGSNDFFWADAPENQPADAWQVHSELPARMMDNAAATNGSHVYVAAGYNIGNVFYRHDINSTTWETMAPCPLDLCTGGAAIIGDTFYYCGGYRQGMSAAADTLLKYSISGNNWTAAPGPHPGWGYNWSPTVVACAGKLYYCSGCSVPGATAPTRRVWCYTPGAGWSQVASMNQGRVFANAVAYHDTIWVAGGIADNVALSHTEFYDPVADTWIVDNSVFPQMPQGRWGAACGLACEKMFIATGVLPNMSLTDSTFYFDFRTRSWSVEDGIPLRVYRTVGCGTPNDRAHVYGGSIVGFNPTDTCQYTVLTPPAPNDVGLLTIVKPGSVVRPGEPLAPEAVIKNFGTNPASNIPVYCRIDSAGNQVYSANLTYPGPLAPGGRANVVFSPNWIPGPLGATYNVRMWTALANDTNRANDTLTRQTRSSDQLVVLWLYSDYSQPDTTLGVRLLALGDSLVYMYVQNTTPTIEQLLPYAAVGAHSNYPYADPTALGNVLAAYVDLGGGVVLGNFSFTEGWAMGGQIMTGNYATIGAGANTHLTTTLGWFNPSHPVMAGVDSVREYYAASGYFISTDTVARWADGRPYVAVSANQKVVGVNSYPGIYSMSPPQRGGDWALVFHNALRFVAGMVGVNEFDPLRPALNVRLVTSPNPVQKRLVVNYAVAGGTRVELGMFDLNGRLVRRLYSGNGRSGINQVVWDMTDDQGSRVAAGVYFCKLTTGDKTATAKVVVE
ncbi:MAG: T9SS type A sorting domain-containing protein [candidate division WOR-3 bacterium]